MKKYTLYTTHCPKCRILEKKLNDKNIKFDICEDIDKMKEIGILSVPVLQVDDKTMDFYEAIQFVNSLQ